MTHAYCIDADGFLVSEILLDDARNTLERPDLVLVTPPVHQPGTLRRFDRAAGSWQHVVDDRGTAYVTAEATLWRVERVGQAPPAGAVLADSPEGRLRLGRPAAWERIKRAREQASAAPIEVAGRVFDADPESLVKIMGAIQLAAAIGPAFSIDWTLADNTTATLDAPGITAVGVAIGERTAANHQRARQLREVIEAAASAEELEAISW